jgi:O-antigen/teichoic acid export membrane protein
MPKTPALDPNPKSSGSSLRANFLWIFTGNVAYCACQWAILVALAKLSNPLELGRFALGLAIASPILTFTNLQLKVVQSTDASGLYRFGDYFGLRLITTVIGLAGIVLIAFVGRFGPESALVIVAVGLAKAIESLSDLLYGQFQRQEAMKRVGVSMMLRGVGSVVALVIALYVARNVLWGALAIMATGAITWVAHDLPWAAKLLRHDGGAAGSSVAGPREGVMRPRWSRPTLVSLVRLAFPLGLVMVMVALNQNIPRYFVAYRLGEADLGIFSALAYAMVAMTAVGEALGVAAAPKLSRYFAAGQYDRFRSLVVKLAVLVAALGVGGVAIAKVSGGPLLALIYTPAFAERADVFFWLMIAAVGMAVANLMSFAVSAARQFTIQVPLFLAVLLMSAAGCYFLVPVYGMLGAAIAVAISGMAHICMAVGVLVWVLASAARRQQDQFTVDTRVVSGVQEA